MGMTHKALVSRYAQLYAMGDEALADEIIDPDFIDHTHPEAPPGPEGVKREVAAFRAAFPDATVAVEQVIGEGDMVAFRFTLRGTQRGPLGTIPPTGKRVTLTGMDFIRIIDGKCAELWSTQDTLGLLHQLGVLPGE